MATRDNGKENGNYYDGLYRDYIGFNIVLYAAPGKQAKMSSYSRIL